MPPTELTVAALAERSMRAHVDVYYTPTIIASCRSVLERCILPVPGGISVIAVGRWEIAAHRLQPPLDGPVTPG